MTKVVDMGIEFLQKHHFDACPVWRDDRDKDLHFPVNSPDELPHNPKDMLIKAEFFAPNGMKFEGCIKGIDKGIDTLLVIWIYYNGKEFGFNHNLPDLCHEQLEELIKELPEGSVKNEGDIFPIRYETRFDWEAQGYKNFWGTFDAFLKERKEED